MLKAHACHGYHYCSDHFSLLDNDLIVESEEISEADFPHFTPCDECGRDVFGREAEDAVFRGNTLRDRILEAARVLIEEQEGVLAKVKQWRLLDGTRHHKIIAQVMLTTDQNCEPFEVWVIADLDTEEVECI